MFFTILNVKINFRSSVLEFTRVCVCVWEWPHNDCVCLSFSFSKLIQSLVLSQHLFIRFGVLFAFHAKDI